MKDLAHDRRAADLAIATDATLVAVKTGFLARGHLPACKGECCRT